jgi:hypothetical protein
MEEQKQDYSHIPLDSRIVDKNWKIRQSGYESLTLLFQSPPLPDHLQIRQLHKCLIEANPIALDKAVGMLRAYVAIGGVLETEGFIKNAIEKGIG